MQFISRCAPHVAALLALLAGSAASLADVPAVLDRVPANVPVVIAVRNMDQVKAKTVEIAKLVGGQIDAGPMMFIEGMLGTQGLNKTGSAAVLALADKNGQFAPDDSEPPTVILVPVSDYSAMVKALNATTSGAISSMRFNDKDTYCKDIGGGYAALSEHKAIVESFEAGKGMKAEHGRRLGASGNRIADSCDVFIIADVNALRDKIEDGIQKAKDNAGQMAQMAGGNEKMAENIDMMQKAAEEAMLNATVAVVGAGFSDNGLFIDFGMQFKDGSEANKTFGSAGRASSFTSKLPRREFLFAGGMDLSSPGIKAIFRSLSKVGGGDVGTGGMLGFGSNVMQFIDNIDGQAFLMGATDFGAGMFNNTVTYVGTKNSRAFIDSTKQMYEAMNGKSSEGMTYTSTFKPGAVEVSGQKADSWSLKMSFDDNDPMAMQKQMMMSMLIGQENELSGLIMPAEGGVVTTMARNQRLLSAALDSAKTGKGLSEDEYFNRASGMLQEGRTMEVYIGTKSLLETLSGVMMMMGGGPDIPTPEKASPIGLGMTSDGGGMSLRLAIPTDVLKLIGDVRKSMDAGEEDMPQNVEKKRTPRF